MADILFDEDQEFRRRAVIERKPYFVRLVLATGIVATEEQANYVLLSIVVLCFVVIFFLLSSGTKHSKPSQTQIEQSGQYLKEYSTRDSKTAPSQ